MITIPTLRASGHTEAPGYHGYLGRSGRVMAHSAPIQSKRGVVNGCTVRTRGSVGMSQLRDTQTRHLVRRPDGAYRIIEVVHVTDAAVPFAVADHDIRRGML
jgi:hypothetical protein